MVYKEGIQPSNNLRFVESHPIEFLNYDKPLEHRETFDKFKHKFKQHNQSL